MQHSSLTTKRRDPPRRLQIPIQKAAAGFVPTAAFSLCILLRLHRPCRAGSVSAYCVLAEPSRTHYRRSALSPFTGALNNWWKRQNFPHFVHQFDCIGADISDPVAAVRSHRASLISSLVEIIPADEITHRFAGRPPHGGVDRNRSPPRQGERSPPVALLAPGQTAAAFFACSGSLSLQGFLLLTSYFMVPMCFLMIVAAQI